MRLFGYYAWHSFVNQLKKLFKTWVLIFFAACLLLGVLIGLGASMLEDAAGEEEPPVEHDVTEAGTELAQTLRAAPGELIELAVGGVILAAFVVSALSADKNGSRIFLPADVNLLFASPLQPQSVLLFRLMTQLGTSLLAGVYLLFQVPNLVFNLGMRLWAALALIVVWCMTVAVGKLLQLLLYTVCSTRPAWKRRLRGGVYAFLALLAGAYLLCWKLGGNSPLRAALDLFNAPVTRFLPLWGWLKGIFVYASEDNLPGALACLAAVVVGSVLLTAVIWRIKADFYEDAMAKSEETAALLERAQSEKSALAVVRRKTDRSDRLQRDGLRHGRGATVFFHKAMYNRFRFARLGVFTKTAVTYLLAAAGVAALCRFVLATDGLIPVVLTLSAFVFFRAMGNPLEQDTQMDCFLLIPESTWHKLFFSLLGGAANCLLDLLPAVLAAAVLLGTSPLRVLAWLPLVVSVDFFATTVGAFIGLSVPAHAGKLIKQVVQIMFLYFGLLPDVAIMAVGLTFSQAEGAAVACAVVNTLLGLVFFSLTPLFLEPPDGTPYAPERPFAGDLGAARRQFSRLGFAVFAILAVGTAAQILLMLVLDAALPGWQAQPWGIWLVTFAPLYLIAIPVGLLLLRAVPARPPERHALGPGRLAVAAIVCIFLMYAGNLLGLAVTALLRLLPGVSAENPLLGYAMTDALLPKLLFMVVLAPVLEEYVFRRQLIDRMRPYGEKLAVVVSALLFGMFHGNLSQLFYAVALGLVFGYVYLKTGLLRYSIALHMFINLLGSVVGPWVAERASVPAEADAAEPTLAEMLSSGQAGLFVYGLVILSLAVAGFVLLCIHRRRLTFAPAALELPRGSRFRTVFLNAGMLLLTLGCTALIVVSLL
ncbi:MAG: CPBP family intramembrane metalloprotease [Oscillospiraceae bacterium]|nr:CPBP family intramembrane metalloprotease [Oscillospiraceae bacterium]